MYCKCISNAANKHNKTIALGTIVVFVVAIVVAHDTAEMAVCVAAANARLSDHTTTHLPQPQAKAELRELKLKRRDSGERVASGAKVDRAWSVGERTRLGVELCF